MLSYNLHGVFPAANSLLSSSIALLLSSSTSLFSLENPLVKIDVRHSSVALFYMQLSMCDTKRFEGVKKGTVQNRVKAISFGASGIPF